VIVIGWSIAIIAIIIIIIAVVFVLVTILRTVISVCGTIRSMLIIISSMSDRVVTAVVAIGWWQRRYYYCFESFVFFTWMMSHTQYCIRLSSDNKVHTISRLTVSSIAASINALSPSTNLLLVVYTEHDVLRRLPSRWYVLPCDTPSGMVCHHNHASEIMHWFLSILDSSGLQN